MDSPLEACRWLFSRFDHADGLIQLDELAVCVLALERGIDQGELQAVTGRLALRNDGAVSFSGACETISYVMKGEPCTLQFLSLTSPSGTLVEVSLVDVVKHQLKALFEAHPAFSDQSFWIHKDTEPHAACCVAEGDGLSIGNTEDRNSFILIAKDWLGRPVESGGASFEVKSTPCGVGDIRLGPESLVPWSGYSQVGSEGACNVGCVVLDVRCWVCGVGLVS